MESVLHFRMYDVQRNYCGISTFANSNLGYAEEFWIQFSAVVNNRLEDCLSDLLSRRVYQPYFQCVFCSEYPYLLLIFSGILETR